MDVVGGEEKGPALNKGGKARKEGDERRPRRSRRPPRRSESLAGEAMPGSILDRTGPKKHRYQLWRRRPLRSEERRERDDGLDEPATRWLPLQKASTGFEVRDQSFVPPRSIKVALDLPDEIKTSSPAFARTKIREENGALLLRDGLLPSFPFQDNPRYK